MNNITMGVFSMKHINAGFLGENEVSEVSFDFSEWAEEFGSDGSVGLVIQRPTDTEAYPVALTTDGNVATWKITATDLEHEGTGVGQLSYYVGDAIKKSIVFEFRVNHSIENTTTPPDPYESWLDTLGSLGSQTQANAEAAASSASIATENAQASAVSATKAQEYSDAAKTSAEEASESANSASENTNRSLEYMNSASISASDAEAFGAGTRDGSEVESGDDAYHNNAKYYAQQAAQSATTLVTDETLTQRGRAADSYAVGDALHKKADIGLGITGASVNQSIFVGSVDENGVPTGYYADNSGPIPLYITIVRPPDKTAYLTNETFDPTGMIVHVTWSDGRVQAIDNTQLAFSPSRILDSTVNVVVTYDDTLGRVMNALQPITVKYPASMAITTPPIKTAYEPGGVFDMTGMVATITWSDGDTSTPDNSALSVSPSILEYGDTSVTVTYNDHNDHVLRALQPVSVTFAPPYTWSKLVHMSRLGVANQFLDIGGVISSTYTVGNKEYTCPWIVVGFRDAELESGEIYHNVPVLQMQYTSHEPIVFDPKEEFVSEDAIAQDGFYYVGYNGTNYTILRLNAGDTIPYGSYVNVYKTKWNSTNPVQYGLNDWKMSFMRQYLNNSGTGWAQLQHECDVLPANASSMTGFMTYIDPEMLEVLHPTKVQTHQPSYIGGGIDTTYDIFFPLSVSEMNMSNASASSDDGAPTDYYKELLGSNTKVSTGTYDVLKRYSVANTTASQIYWNRSASIDSLGVWVVSSSGFVHNHYSPSDSLYQCPACMLI